jgi:putative acetyltransferase
MVESRDVTFRPMKPAEFPSVRDVQVAAFGGDDSIARLVDLLRASWAWEDELSFVAEASGELVAHVLFTHAFLDASSRLVDVLVMSPMGVHPDWQGRGVGTELITMAITALGQRTEPVVFVEGDPGFYSRFGFEPGAGFDFTRPSERIPEKAFMALLLPSYESWMTGRLVYPDAFWRVDAVGLR